MYQGILFILVILHINNVFCIDKPANLPCKIEDVKCSTGMTQWLFDRAIEGNVKEGIENLDPLHLPLIDGIQGYANYTLKDSILEGYKNCTILNASFKPEVSQMHINVHCPRYHMTGSYDIVGSLNNYPIEGKGPFYIITTNYNLTINTDVSTHKKGDNLFFKLTTFTVDADLLGTVDFELKNLFDGNKELSDPIHEFGKENPKAFASFLDKPIFKEVIKKLLENFNAILKDISVKELLQVNVNSLKIEN